MFIRITACWLADPLSGLLHQGLRAFHCFHARLGWYRMERKLPGGFIYSPTGVLRLSTAHSKHALSDWRADSQQPVHKVAADVRRLSYRFCFRGNLSLVTSAATGSY